MKAGALIGVDLEGDRQLGLCPEDVGSGDLDLMMAYRSYSAQREDDLITADLIAHPTSLTSDIDADLLLVGIGEGDGEGFLRESRDADLLVGRERQHRRIILLRLELTHRHTRLEPPAVDSFDSDMIGGILRQSTQRRNIFAPGA